MGSTFKISGTNFTNNKGVGYGSGNPNVGALLTWYGCEGTISDCNFMIIRVFPVPVLTAVLL
jgi:hypothetical protein